jgi:uncharacterized phage-associated protein
MSQKIKAIDVAEWFVQKAIVDTDSGGEYMTQLKLQKLLYYVQGFYMAVNNGTKLFDGTIAKLQYGPVVKELMTLLGKYKSNPIMESIGGNASGFDNKALAILEFVYEKFGQFSASKLVSMTHEETPWKEAEFGKEIKTDTIFQFFKQNYVY